VASIDDAKLIDREALCRMADRLASMANVHAILVSRGGKLVFERYFTGSDEVPGRIVRISRRRVDNLVFDADTPHNMMSASKSVASLLLGIAVDRVR
jgi:CubicO group peptidase (beta-lactamase class C family)